MVGRRGGESRREDTGETQYEKSQESGCMAETAQVENENHGEVSAHASFSAEEALRLKIK